MRDEEDLMGAGTSRLLNPGSRTNAAAVEARLNPPPR